MLVLNTSSKRNRAGDCAIRRGRWCGGKVAEAVGVLRFLGLAWCTERRKSALYFGYVDVCCLLNINTRYLYPLASSSLVSISTALFVLLVSTAILYFTYLDTGDLRDF